MDEREMLRRMWETLTHMSHRVLAIDARTRDLHERAFPRWPGYVSVVALLLAAAALGVACGVQP